MEPTPLEQLVPGLPAGLSEVVQRMMRKSPDERYATPLQVAQALEPFGDEYGKATSRSDAQLLRSGAATDFDRGHLTQANVELVKRAPKSDVPAHLAAQADGFGLKTPPDPAFERDAAPEGKISSTVRSPDSGQGSDPEFPVNLILGPEPSLTEGLSRPKTRSSNSGTSTEGTVLSRLPRYSLWGLSALTVTVMLIVATLAVVNPFGETKGSLKKAPVPDVISDAESRRKSIEKDDNATGKSKPAPDIVVRIEGEQDREFTADKLADAIGIAMGSRGRVESENTKPLRLTSTNLKPLDFSKARGGLIISALRQALSPSSNLNWAARNHCWQAVREFRCCSLVDDRGPLFRTCGGAAAALNQRIW